jgi:anti-sigma-K factor RskA
VNDDDELQTPFGDILADPRTWEAPAPGGADALLAAIAAERGTAPAGRRAAPVRPPFGDAGTPPPTLRPDEPPRAVPPSAEPERSVVTPIDGRRRARSRWLAVAAAAAVVVVAATVGVALSTGGDDGDAREVALQGSELAPDASATATVEELGSGVAIEIDVSDLPPAEPGTYYQAWLKSPDGALVTIGTFHMRGGDDVVELWAGVDLADYPLLTVTLQREGAGQESSGEVVLSGEVGP